ncbi:MAG: T9SS type A sorting domain-containing protein [Saprospiraceae bacterium]|nr:T9SS type A sorting domain-containing protein [Saprospiraceae bacterium]
MTTSTFDVLDENEVSLEMGPNPMQDFMLITSSPDKPILDVAVYNMAGKLVKGSTNVNNNQYLLRRTQHMNNGMYVVQLRFKEGIVSKKIMLK